VAVYDALGDLDELSVVSARVVAEQVVGGLFVDVVALHEDAFGAFGGGATGERAL
jgi:hypothetical protein